MKISSRMIQLAPNKRKKFLLIINYNNKKRFMKLKSLEIISTAIFMHGPKRNEPQYGQLFQNKFLYWNFIKQHGEYEANSQRKKCACLQSLTPFLCLHSVFLLSQE